MSCKFVNNTSHDLSSLTTFAKDLYSFGQKKLGFNKPPVIMFDSDPENGREMLGKTGYYDPSEYKIVVYIDNRHPKDILRSISHELVHHTQNCRGDLNNTAQTTSGYAQEDEHLRNMEREAYEKGNLEIFRDWEDLRKKKLQETIYKSTCYKGERRMSIEDWKNKEINTLLMEKWGYSLPGQEKEALLTEDVDAYIDLKDGGSGGEKRFPEDSAEEISEDEDDEGEGVVELSDPLSPDQRLKNLDETKLRNLIREKISAALANYKINK